MKTIQLPDEMYEHLMQIAQEIETQNNRATAKPYFFQIRTDKKEWDSGTKRFHLCYVDFSSDPYEFEAIPEDIRDLCDAFDLEEPQNLKNMDKDDIHDWVINHSDLNVQECSYDIAHEYQNAFFTEKACKAHIEQNNYHYSNPVDYLQHAFRNPEMDLMFGFFESLITDKPKSINTVQNILEWGIEEFSHFSVSEIVSASDIKVLNETDGYGNQKQTFHGQKFQHVGDDIVGHYLVHQIRGGLTEDNFYGELLIPFGEDNQYVLASYNS